MVYKLIVTGRARIHLERLLSYLVYVLENSQAASHLLEEIKMIYLRMQENPKQFPCCQDSHLKEKNYRKAVLPTMNYIVIFKVEERAVYVLGIFHDSENYSDKL